MNQTNKQTNYQTFERADRPSFLIDPSAGRRCVNAPARLTTQ